jgi:hypothetical protein
MNFEIIKIPHLSGNKASLYTIRIETEDKNETLFERFLQENAPQFETELDDIIQRLHTIGHKRGAQEHFFKLHEGKLGDGVCALFDEPDKNLRLYCIRTGKVNVILGSGGVKSKAIRAFQEDSKLNLENKFIRAVSKLLYQRLRNKEIWYARNEMDLLGDLTFTEEDLF